MKRRRIFVSSVQRELSGERAALRDYLHDDPLLRRFFDVFLFEDLPAADRRADAVYLKEVAACDVYLGLFGNEYGVENAAGLSPTEREFVRATQLRKPRLIYVKGADDKGRHTKMRALIQRAGSELIRRRFVDTGSLLPAVYASLVAWLEEHRLLLNGPFDAEPCKKATLGDLDPARMKEFIREARESRGFPLRAAATSLELLTHLNLLDDLHGRHPTHAAVLVFGRAPQRFLPSSEIKCAHFHGTEVAKPIPSYQVYKGTVFALVDQAVDFVMSKLALRVGTRVRSAKAPVAYEIPREVVAEGIVNAVAHRNYASSASVQVMLFADRLEVWNPGRLPASLPLARLREPHGSVPHNPSIAEPMYLTQYIERLGTGIGDMIRRCREAGLREPAFEITDGFRLTIWRDGRPKSSVESSVESSGKRSGKRSGKTLGEMGHRIVVLIQEQPDIMIAEIAQRLGRTARGVEKQIRKLREAEVIGRVGPTKGGHWEVLNRVENDGRKFGEKVGIRVGIKFGEKVGIKLTTNQQRILDILVQQPRMTAPELAKAIGISQRKIEQNVASLKKMGRLLRIGSRKTGHWEVLK